MTDKEKIQLKDRLLDVIEKLHGVRDLVEFIKGRYIVKPNKRYKVGKEFSNTLDKINELIDSPPRFHVYILKTNSRKRKRRFSSVWSQYFL